MYTAPPPPTPQRCVENDYDCKRSNEKKRDQLVSQSSNSESLVCSDVVNSKLTGLIRQTAEQEGRAPGTPLLVCLRSRN